MEIDGTHALVVGGSGGIGQATALALARHGARVTVQYASSKDRAQACVTAIEAAGGTAQAVPAAVDDAASIAALVERSTGAFGPVRTLVNSAGTTSFVAARDLEGLTDEIWERSFRVNVLGPWYATRAVLPAMVDAGGGAVVNVASRAGISGTGSSVAYSASKAALINMTKALARAFAPSVRVNAVAPGFVDTGWFSHNGIESDAAVDALRDTWVASTPLHRAAVAEDVAGAVEWLVCHGELVTGEVMVLDSGMHLGPSVFQQGGRTEGRDR